MSEIKPKTKVELIKEHRFDGTSIFYCEADGRYVSNSMVIMSANPPTIESEIADLQRALEMLESVKKQLEFKVIKEVVKSDEIQIMS